MIEGTGVVLIGTLVLVALYRAVRDRWYRKGWQEGRDAMEAYQVREGRRRA